MEDWRAITGEMLEQFLIAEGWKNDGPANYALGPNRDHCGGGLTLYVGPTFLAPVSVLIPPPQGDPWYKKHQVGFGLQTRESLRIVAKTMRITVPELIVKIQTSKGDQNASTSCE